LEKPFLTLFYMDEMKRMLTGEMEDAEMAHFLSALAERGETVEELVEMAGTMRDLSIRVEGGEDALDVCGTGGSGLSRINTSTLAAFVLAAGGVKVAKHGNRASSGRCGSFDVLEAVGVNIELDSHQVSRTLELLNIGFIYARLFHPGMKYVMPVRKQLGIRTVFNSLGPLTNPARVKYQVLGCSEVALGRKMIEVLKGLGHQRALIVCGSDGLDEITLTGSTTCLELKDGKVFEFEFLPKSVVEFDDISGGDEEVNAAIFQDVIYGENMGPHRELVCVNAGAGFYVMGHAKSIEQGAGMARELLASGKVGELFDRYVLLTNEL